MSEKLVGNDDWELLVAPSTKEMLISKNVATSNIDKYSPPTKQTPPNSNAIISNDQLEKYRSDFAKNCSAHVAQNTCQDTSVYDLSKNRRLIQRDAFTFSHCVDLAGLSITDQKDSGRCWLFAFLNHWRIKATKVLNVDDFEFSEAYLHFFDKLEKANAFLENVIQTAQLPLEDRKVQVLFDDPVGDGGEWQMAASLTRKYGLVPKFAYPESYTSTETDDMNDSLGNLLVFRACNIRSMILEGGGEDKIATYKSQSLEDVYRILSIHLGTPPTTFEWQWRDSDGNFQDKGTMTPLEFANWILNSNSSSENKRNGQDSNAILGSYVSLLHDPRNPYYQNYTSEFAETVLGGAYKVVFLNVPIEEIKEINKQILMEGNAVWFACNVGQEFTDYPGLWDQDLYQLDSLYGVEIGQLPKKDRIRVGYPMGTHAMLMTGADVVKDDNNSKARRWKVENSWGKDGGHDGYYTMNDNWYDENVFEIVSPISYCLKNPKIKKGLATEPIVLPAWDPICSKSKRRP